MSVSLLGVAWKEDTLETKSGGGEMQGLACLPRSKVRTGHTARVDVGVKVALSNDGV